MGWSNGEGRRLVDQYFAQYDAAPVTVEKLRWLLAKAVASAEPSHD